MPEQIYSTTCLKLASFCSYLPPRYKVSYGTIRYPMEEVILVQDLDLSAEKNLILPLRKELSHHGTRIHFGAVCRPQQSLAEIIP
jgi:hypothetical protein